jgi:hypothetical protein
MTEEIKNQVSGEPTQETGLPQPTFSDTVPASSTSALSPEQIKAFSDALKPVIEEVVERKVQSAKDKRFSSLEKGESVMREVLATLKSQNVAIPKELEQELQIKDYIDQRLAGVAPTTDKSMSSAGANQTGGFNVVEELNQLGLSTNNPDVVKLVGGQYRNADHFRAEAAKLALKLSKPFTPSDTVSPAPAGSSVVAASATELIGTYKKEMLANRGKKDVMKAIKDKYRSSGVPVDNIDILK